MTFILSCLHEWYSMDSVILCKIGLEMVHLESCLHYVRSDAIIIHNICNGLVKNMHNFVRWFDFEFCCLYIGFSDHGAS